MQTVEATAFDAQVESALSKRSLPFAISASLAPNPLIAEEPTTFVSVKKRGIAVHKTALRGDVVPADTAALTSDPVRKCASPTQGLVRRCGVKMTPTVDQERPAKVERASPSQCRKMRRPVRAAPTIQIAGQAHAFNFPMGKVGALKSVWQTTSAQQAIFVRRLREGAIASRKI